MKKSEIRTLLVAMRLGDTPVLIPNTMVKTQAAEGTILETVWESRWVPEIEIISFAVYIYTGFYQ